MSTSRTAKATAAPHRPDCPCGRCIHRRRLAGLPEPTPRIPTDDVLAKRAAALRRVIYKAQRAVDRGNRLLAQLAPAQRAPGKSGDAMEEIRRWKAAGMPDD
jgi:hypothetical protein